MNSKWFMHPITACVVGALCFASSASASPKELVGVVNGATVDSGWAWDVSSAVAPLVNLVFIGSTGNMFSFEKDVEILRASDPITITFTRTLASAKTLVINDEAVTNHTGTDWQGFRMELSSGSVGNTPNFAFMTSDGSAGIGDFKIDPFTQFAFYNNNAGLLLNGGTVKNNSTWFPGSQSNSGLAIIANDATSQTFSLKEIPFGTVVAAAIPLPMAAWSGASTLLALGLVSSRKRIAAVLA